MASYTKGKEAAFSPARSPTGQQSDLCLAEHTQIAFLLHVAKTSFPSYSLCLALYGPSFPERMKCDRVG